MCLIIIKGNKMGHFCLKNTANTVLCVVRGGSKPNKSTQLTLDSLFVKGASKQVDEAKRLGKNWEGYKIQHTHTHT